MTDDERPRKLVKLEHDEATQSELEPAMTGAGEVAQQPENTAVKIEDVKQDLSEQPNANAEPNTATAVQPDAAGDDAPKMSKNQLKKLRKREKWEQEREQRKIHRREKMADKRVRRQAMVEQARVTGGEEAVAELRKSWEGLRAKARKSTLLPFAIIIDCGYDDLMNPKERVSLSSQLTRSYSENTRAKWRSNLMFSSFNKLLKERFDNVLGAHKNWRGIRIIQEDFMKAAELARRNMGTPRGGRLAGPFAGMTDAKPEDGEIIYLSSDSDNTLTELKPYDTYIIGGLVDKNRHKAVCYKSAMAAGIKTAKLPIGEYIKMDSRSVLTTNHVVDIMLKWLELGDWGEAFMKVLPQRKGGKLLDESLDAEGEVEEHEDEHENEEDQIAAVEAAADDGCEEGEDDEKI
ncbi:hypothetical protein N7520_003842 [Penicillium odoratum]|uniref:uncharacterized protein n=1 Tax=Penicillium odoratum TaxID=1167516 RepID=UPI00254957B7|nr:uncharacterized protein N7520_003842 [Penicillium odoratum]KAJ5769283.1 hypothetical protein N7520_003842 [Penicillium odoratum]